MKCETLCLEWHIIWRQRIKEAYLNKSEQMGYCNAAALAQMLYVCYHACESWHD